MDEQEACMSAALAKEGKITPEEYLAAERGPLSLDGGI
jgi:hypothetical protein